MKSSCLEELQWLFEVENDINTDYHLTSSYLVMTSYSGVPVNTSYLKNQTTAESKYERHLRD